MDREADRGCEIPAARGGAFSDYMVERAIVGGMRGRVKDLKESAPDKKRAWGGNRGDGRVWPNLGCGL